jgi:SAM-dependent methyltransferase
MKRLVRRLLRPGLPGAPRRTMPVSDDWGYDRGQPVDRYYIDRFLAEHRADIRGRALEVRENLYVDRYGSGVSECDVLDVDPDNPRATIAADLSEPRSLPQSQFDCIVLTQTLQYVGDVAIAVQNLREALRPEGVLLATVPGVNRADEDPRRPSLWSFTEAGGAKVFAPEFGEGNVEVRSYGNVLAATSFLTGLARQELRPEELDAHDLRFPVIVAVRAVRR